MKILWKKVFTNFQSLTFSLTISCWVHCRIPHLDWLFYITPVKIKNEAWELGSNQMNPFFFFLVILRKLENLSSYNNQRFAKVCYLGRTFCLCNTNIHLMNSPWIAKLPKWEDGTRAFLFRLATPFLSIFGLTSSSVFPAIDWALVSLLYLSWNLSLGLKPILKSVNNH